MEIQVYKRNNSPYYQIRYKDSKGNLIRESTKETNLRAAGQFVEKRRQELSKAEGIPGAENLTLRDLINSVVEDYHLNQRKSLDRIQFSIKWIYKHTDQRLRLVNFTSQDWADYAAYRLNIDGAKPATINRELAILKRGYNLLIRRGRLATKPYISMLKERNVRKGFLEPEQFIQLINHLPNHLRFPVLFMYHTGWRTKEVLNLQWQHVNLNEGYILLPFELSKNEEGRTYYIPSNLMTIFRMSAEANGKCPYVFTNRQGTDKIKDFRSAWKTALKNANLPAILPHDLRRSAVRNFVRAGVPQKVAQTIVGHKTDSIFQRYNIVSEEDLRSASQRQMEYINLKTGGNGNGGGQDKTPHRSD